jgi:hypothetical protein
VADSLGYAVNWLFNGAVSWADIGVPWIFSFSPQANYTDSRPPLVGKL